MNYYFCCLSWLFDFVAVFLCICVYMGGFVGLWGVYLFDTCMLGGVFLWGLFVFVF